MQEILLAANDLRKTFAERPVVNGISFSILRGEIFGLLGPNGAGKTTTISMLSGLIKPTSGSVIVAGYDFARQEDVIKAKIGLVPQELALYPTLSAWDNLLFFGRIYGLRGKALRARVKSVLEMVGLEERAGETVATYSGGMKRRINIAAGLLHEPEILFLDEPTVGVDPQSRNAIFESLEALKEAGLTILYTTHYMEEAQRLCDRVAIMDQGRILVMDTPKNLIQGLGGSVIRMGLNNGHLDAVCQRGRLCSSIKTIVCKEDHLMAETNRVQDGLISLLEVTNELDAHVTQLEVLEPSLETVFLQLTGKSLRD